MDNGAPLALQLNHSLHGSGEDASTEKNPYLQVAHNSLNCLAAKLQQAKNTASSLRLQKEPITIASTSISPLLRVHFDAFILAVSFSVSPAYRFEARLVLSIISAGRAPSLSVDNRPRVLSGCTATFGGMLTFGRRGVALGLSAQGRRPPSRSVGTVSSMLRLCVESRGSSLSMSVERRNRSLSTTVVIVYSKLGLSVASRAAMLSLCVHRRGRTNTASMNSMLSLSTGIGVGMGSMLRLSLDGRWGTLNVTVDTR